MNAQPTDEYARSVVKQVMMPDWRKPVWYWQGNFSGWVWLINTFLWKSAFVRLLSEFTYRQILELIMMTKGLWDDEDFWVVEIGPGVGSRENGEGEEGRLESTEEADSLFRGGKGYARERKNMRRRIRWKFNIQTPVTTCSVHTRSLGKQIVGEGGVPIGSCLSNKTMLIYM